MNALNSKVATSFAALVSDTIKLINKKLNLKILQYQKMNQVNLNSYYSHMQTHHTDTKDAGKIPILTGLSNPPKETVVS